MQFSVDGQGCVPSLFIDPRPNYGGGNEDNGNLLQKVPCTHCCTQYGSKFGNLSSGHRTGKGQFSFKSQRKAMTKNAQTTTKLHSSHTLAK